jgi:hypothetical protein
MRLLSFATLFCLSSAIAALVPAAPAVADGLIFRLPPDGAFAEFQGEAVASMELSPEVERLLTPEGKVALGDKQTKLRVTVTVSSVGRVRRAGQACRWIEMKWTTEDDRSGARNENVLKVLVAARYLRRGQDPLAHAALTFFNPKGVDRDGVEPAPGFNRIQYELDRFRPVFPEPLRKVVALPKRTVTSPAGTFKDCEVISGVTSYDGPLWEGRMEFQSEWEIALHEDAPFGIVEMRCRSAGAELGLDDEPSFGFKGTTTLTLAKIGTGAVSSLAVPQASGDDE